MDVAHEDAHVRREELDTLEAIYPELRRFPDAPLAFELELPVQPERPVTVLFPAAPAPPDADAAPGPSAPAADGDSFLVSYLPPLSLRIALPDGYPAERPPVVAVSTTPEWLPPETLAGLEDDARRLWVEAGRDLVAYAYIDHVQRAAADVFGAVSAEGTLEVDPEHKLAVLDYDIKAKKAAFDRETFECSVCLDPKKGARCHKMLDCGHVFCLQCLQDFYNDAIKEGNLSVVRCLAPNCAKERAAAAEAAAADGAGARQNRRPNRIFISPRELLQMGLSEDTAKHYVALRYKTELESDKNTVYCPRQWCGGASRSSRRKKPDGLELPDEPDAEPEQDPGGGSASDTKAKFNPADLLSVCEDCGFAFCSRCLQTWHGEFVRCVPKGDKDAITEEEQTSLDYLRLHTSPCPTCGAPAQKTHGCNHMVCSRCDTHFCYLCSAWLDPANPYRHYNHQSGGRATSCHMRLWELENGDVNDVGLGFAGGRRGGGGGGGGPVAMGPVPDVPLFELPPHEVPPFVRPAGDRPQGQLRRLRRPPVNRPEPADAMVVDAPPPRHGPGLGNADGNNNNPGDEAPADHQQHQAGEPVLVAREGPLVLRLVDNQARCNTSGQRGGRNDRPAAARAAPDRPPAAAAAAAGGPRGQNPRGGRVAVRGARIARARAARAEGPRAEQDEAMWEERRREGMARALRFEYGNMIDVEPILDPAMDWMRRLAREAREARRGQRMPVRQAGTASP